MDFRDKRIDISNLNNSDREILFSYLNQVNKKWIFKSKIFFTCKYIFLYKTHNTQSSNDSGYKYHHLEELKLDNISYIFNDNTIKYDPTLVYKILDFGSYSKQLNEEMQKFLFSNDIEWICSKKKLIYLDHKHIYIHRNNILVATTSKTDVELSWEAFKNLFNNNITNTKQNDTIRTTETNLRTSGNGTITRSNRPRRVTITGQYNSNSFRAKVRETTFKKSVINQKSLRF